MPLISGDGAPPPLVMVVEYLESSMSNDLLYKFPDNSAFDFDYSQSSIWSPLLPRPPPSSSAAHGGAGAKKLSFGENDEVGLLENTKKIAGTIKRKFTDALLNNVSRCTKMKRRRRKSFGFSPVAPPRRRSASSTSPKGWAKVVKAAAKHFKKRKNTNKNTDFDFDFSNFLTKS